AASSDNVHLASLDLSARVKIWDTTTGKEVGSFSDFTSHAKQLAFSPDGRFLAASTRGDQALLLWEVAARKETRTLPAHGKVLDFAFSPDGQGLAAGTADGNVVIWDFATGRELFLIHAHAGWARALVFGPEGLWVASAGEDRTIRLWDVFTGRELLTL